MFPLNKILEIIVLETCKKEEKLSPNYSRICKKITVPIAKNFIKQFE